MTRKMNYFTCPDCGRRATCLVKTVVGHMCKSCAKRLRVKGSHKSYAVTRKPRGWGWGWFGS